VIIPIGPADLNWRDLLPDLWLLPGPFDWVEVIGVGTTDAPEGWGAPNDSKVEFKWVKAKKGRASQMNQGASLARGNYFWFLHADSRLGPGSVSAIFRGKERNPGALYFFNLVFQSDGPKLTQLNTLGAWFRSHILGIPFGDQGFFLSKELFFELGPFDEKAEFGEDHLLVWKARQKSVPVCCVEEWISTSARRYRDHGWGRTTSRHLFLTAKQGIPEFLKWIRGRI
jgi:glycosyltransferase involved in cell wall biosynthesis